MTAFFKKKKEVPGEAKLSIPEKKIKLKTEEEGGVSAASAAFGQFSGKDGGLDRASVLIRPHVTEKATDLSGRGVYVFDIHQHANKMHVRGAVEKLYKVMPTKINIMNKKSKFMKSPRSGRTQVKQAGVKKALVYLKSGDKIEFV